MSKSRYIVHIRQVSIPENVTATEYAHVVTAESARKAVLNTIYHLIKSNKSIRIFYRDIRDAQKLRGYFRSEKALLISTVMHDFMIYPTAMKLPPYWTAPAIWIEIDDKQLTLKPQEDHGRYVGYGCGCTGGEDL